MSAFYIKHMFTKISFGLLMFCLLEDILAEGTECLSSLKNMAVYDGDQNTLMNLTADPRTVNWTIVPTSDEFDSYSISNYGGYRDPSLEDLFYPNQSGLVILKATMSPNADRISTSGLYLAECMNGTNKTGAKLLVVSGVPECSLNVSSSTNVQLSCSIIYADGTIHPIYAKMTWKICGIVYMTDTPARTRINYLLYETSSTITVNNSVPENHECIVTFNAPIDIEYDFIAMNAPEFIASCSVEGRNYHGSLTKKPTNTADVAGSSNITLECASVYGTNATSWSFTSLDSLSNETIYITNGYELLTTSAQQYILNSTANSSVLVLRQLSNFTEGTYCCSDGVNCTSALLLAIPSSILMEPLIGSIIGGTKIKIIIGSDTVDYVSRYVGTKIRGVRNVYIGENLVSTSVSSIATPSSALEITAVTPSTTEEDIGRSLPIIIEFLPTPYNMTFNRAFTYLPKPTPEITGIYPNSFIVTGGTLFDVFGRGLSYVAMPIIQLTVVIYRVTSNTSATVTRVCTVPPGNDTFMQCPMPSLNLPDDFLEILNSMYHPSTSRRKRYTWTSNQLFAKSLRLRYRLKRSVNSVLTVIGANGIDRAIVYLGFILDGYKKYENINDEFPDTRFLFYSAPEINSSKELIDFDPLDDELIYVKGRYMMRGCRIRDYLVHIGNQICHNSDLTDNQLSCQPTTEKPSPTANDTIYCAQYLSVTITLGYQHYHYACLTYKETSRKLALIVGLVVGLVGFALFLIILIVCIVKFRRRKTVIRVSDRQHRPTTGRHEIRNRHYNSDLPPEAQEDNLYQNKINND